MVGDRRKVSIDLSFNRVLVNLVCRREEDEEALYEWVAQKVQWALEPFPFTRCEQLSGPFEHEQPGSEHILFFEATLASPNGQCFEAKQALQEVDWWN